MVNAIATVFYKILYMSIVGSVVGFTILILIKLFDRKLSAKYKCFMWIISIMFFVIPIIKIPINIPVYNSLETSIKTNYSKITTPNVLNEKQENSTYFNVISAISIIWVCVVFGIFIMFFISNFNLRKKLRNNFKCNDNRIWDILIKCQIELNINKKIDINVNCFCESPCIYGIMAPKIILPYSFVTEDSITLEHIFRHELSHYKRMDLITNFVLLFMVTIHWFNPFVYLFFKKIRQEMELATDELALKFMNIQERKMYGMTLINLLQKCAENKNSTRILCITDDEKNMERRIRMIKNSTGTIHRAIFSVFVFVVIVFACLPFIVEAKTSPSNTLDSKNVYNWANIGNILNDSNIYIDANSTLIDTENIINRIDGSAINSASVTTENQDIETSIEKEKEKEKAIKDKQATSKSARYYRNSNVSSINDD